MPNNFNICFKTEYLKISNFSFPIFKICFFWFFAFHYALASEVSNSMFSVESKSLSVTSPLSSEKLISKNQINITNLNNHFVNFPPQDLEGLHREAFRLYSGRDYDKALIVYKILVQYKMFTLNNPAEAQHMIGLIYKSRNYKSIQEALKWFKMAASQGYGSSSYEIGLIYQSGNDVFTDYYEAARWFRLGAEQRNPLAMNNLGILYSRGQGVQFNYELAYLWFNLAARNGNSYSIRNLERLKRNMTSDSIKYADELTIYCESRDFIRCY